MYYPFGDIPKATKREIEKKSKNSPIVQNAIETCVEQNKQSQVFIGCKLENQEFKDGDLYYSIQHIDIVVSGIRNFDNSWKINVHMGEIYDFTKKRGLNSFADAANDLGYYMQKTGMLIPYRWSVDYSLNYKEN